LNEVMQPHTNTFVVNLGGEEIHMTVKSNPAEEVARLQVEEMRKELQYFRIEVKQSREEERKQLDDLRKQVEDCRQLHHQVRSEIKQFREEERKHYDELRQLLERISSHSSPPPINPKQTPKNYNLFATPTQPSTIPSTVPVAVAVAVAHPNTRDEKGHLTLHLKTTRAIGNFGDTTAEWLRAFGTVVTGPTVPHDAAIVVVPFLLYTGRNLTNEYVDKEMRECKGQINIALLLQIGEFEDKVPKFQLSYNPALHVLCHPENRIVECERTKDARLRLRNLLQEYERNKGF